MFALVPRRIGIGSHCRAKEWTAKVWQVWNRKKIKCGLECDTHKNRVTNRVKII
jgi:hypothetical protein